MERVVEGDVVEATITVKFTRGQSIYHSTTIGRVIKQWTIKTMYGSQRIMTLDNGVSLFTITPGDVHRKLSTLERSLMNL